MRGDSPPAPPPPIHAQRSAVPRDRSPEPRLPIAKRLRLFRPPSSCTTRATTPSHVRKRRIEHERSSDSSPPRVRQASPEDAPARPSPPRRVRRVRRADAEQADVATPPPTPVTRSPSSSSSSSSTPTAVSSRSSSWDAVQSGTERSASPLDEKEVVVAGDLDERAEKVRAMYTRDVAPPLPARVDALKPVTEEKHLEAARDFRRRLEAAAARAPCGACAKMVPKDHLVSKKLDDVPVLDQLAPAHEHAQRVKIGDTEYALCEFGVNVDDRTVSLCGECSHELCVKRKVPDWSLAKLDPGELPAHLRPLTALERALVAPCRLKMMVVYVRGTLRGLRGNVISVRNPPPEELKVEIERSIPRNILDLLDFIRIVLIGPAASREELEKKVLDSRVYFVRPDVVLAWCDWIAAQNAEVAINQANANALRAMTNEQMRELVKGAITHSEKEPPAAGAGYAPGTAGGHDEAEGDVLREVHVDQPGNTEHIRPQQEVAARLLNPRRLAPVADDEERRAAQNTDAARTTIVAACSTELVSEFDARYFHFCFPDLFPFAQHCKPNFNLRGWAATLLSRVNSRWAADANFVLTTANMHLRHTGGIRARLQLRGAKASAIERCTVDSLQHVVRAIARDIAYADLTDDEKLLFRSVKAVVHQQPGLPGSKGRLRPRLLAGLVFFGPPALMVNVNPADLHCPLMFRFAGYDVNIDAEGKSDFVDASQRFRIAMANPVAATQFFDAFIKSFIAAFFRYCRRRRVFEPDSAFTDVVAYHGTVEQNSRGAHHAHFLVWLRGISVAVLMAAVDDEEVRREVFATLTRGETGQLIDKFEAWSVPDEDSLAIYTGLCIRRLLLPTLDSLAGAAVPEAPGTLDSVFEEAMFDNDDQEKYDEERKKDPLPPASEMWPPIPDNPQDTASQTRHLIADLMRHHHGTSCLKGAAKRAGGKGAAKPPVRDGKGKKRCRFHIPREKTAIATIDDSGRLQLRRDRGFLVNYHQGALIGGRCNVAVYAACERRGPLTERDIAANASGIAYYIIKYVSKEDEIDMKRVLTAVADVLNRARAAGPVATHRKITAIVNSLCRGHVMSLPLATAILLKTGDFDASYEVKPLLIRTFVQPFVLGAEAEADATIVPDQHRRLIADNPRVDYLMRPPALENLCPFEMFACFRKLTKPRNCPDSHALLADHPQHKSKTLVASERYVVPMLIGAWPADSDPLEEVYARAVFGMYRERDVPANAKLCDNRACVQVLANLRAHIRAPHDAPQLDQGDVVVHQPEPEEPADPEDPQLDEFAQAAFTIGKFATPGAGRFARPVTRDIGDKVPKLHLREKSEQRDDAFHVPAQVGAVAGAVATLTLEQARREMETELAATQLNDAQKDVVRDAVLALVAPPMPPMVKLVQGTAGTGKTTMINAIVTIARKLKLHRCIAKMAYTGRAAVLMREEDVLYGTTSSLLAINSYGGDKVRDSAAVIEEVQRRFQAVRLIIIDEYSLISPRHLNAIAQMLSFISPHTQKHTFGSFSVMLVGDGLQLPPPRSPSLWTAKSDVHAGRLLFSGIRDVVWLDAVMRQEDSPGGKELIALLNRLRDGKLDRTDLEKINARALGKPNMPTGLDDPAIAGAQLIVLRNSVKFALLDSQVRRWAAHENKQLLVWNSVEGKTKATFAGNTGEASARVPQRGYFYSGMRVILLGNRSFSLCWVHLNTGVAKSIQLDRRERIDANAPVVELKYLPLGVVIKVDGLNRVVADGYAAGEVPILSCRESVTRSTGVSVVRAGFPFMPAVVGTDYFAQGATFGSNVVVDLTPPPGAKNLFANFHVALSRFRTMEHVKLLRPLWSEEEKAWRIVAILRAVQPPVRAGCGARAAARCVCRMCCCSRGSRRCCARS